MILRNKLILIILTMMYIFVTKCVDINNIMTVSLDICIHNVVVADK